MNSGGTPPLKSSQASEPLSPARHAPERGSVLGSDAGWLLVHRDASRGGLGGACFERNAVPRMGLWPQ
ncbi:hypothetical protein EYF80_039532 [Liparis tanakae]|uniref:Uncharacterized protein n=1 Tax=Liparis tanakae TaxID=230148 RepID=A0A4Z2G9M1_9TELE|nr:hypothetical protein EYF80_039532 [Liparis tanakae]